MSSKEKLLQNNSFSSQEILDQNFMKEALKEARQAMRADEVPIGAVLVYENKVIARGHNQVELLHDATAHAEMICLTAGTSFFNDWRLGDTTLYITLEPCIMCAGAILASRVGRLVWGAKDLRVGANGSFVDVFSYPHPMHSVKNITSGVFEEEASELMKLFFQKKRNERKKN